MKFGVNFYRGFCFFVICLFVELDDSFAAGIRYNDYDFPEADDLFANATLESKSKSLPFPILNRPNRSWPYVWGYNYNIFPSTSHFVYALPESSIGYEVPCGIRGGGYNKGEKVSTLSGNRIVGGVQAVPGEFPWQVSLQLLSGWISRHICGGAVISSYWVITAGHCVADLKPKAIVVIAGDHDLFEHEGTEQRVNVVRIVNAGFQVGNFTGDMALLQLYPPLKLGKRVAPICLPNAHKTYLTGTATVAGWGKLSETGELPHVLHHVTLPLMSKYHCKKLYDDAGYGKYLNRCQICGGYDTGGYDSCQGDSGGPLICRHTDRRYYLCGVVSWGVGCARPKLPGVYTEVSCYSDWIKTILYNVNNVVSRLPAYSKKK